MEAVDRIVAAIGDRPHFALALGLLIGVLVPAALLLTIRRGLPGGRCLSAGAAAAGLALVLVNSLVGYPVLLPMRVAQRCVYGATMTLDTVRAQVDVLVYLPVALFSVLALRRVVPVVVGLGLLSIGVETLQLVLEGGTCQTTDVLRNLLGVGIGAGIAAAGIALTPARPAHARRVAERV